MGCPAAIAVVRVGIRLEQAIRERSHHSGVLRVDAHSGPAERRVASAVAVGLRTDSGARLQEQLRDATM